MPPDLTVVELAVPPDETFRITPPLSVTLVANPFTVITPPLNVVLKGGTAGPDAGGAAG